MNKTRLGFTLLEILIVVIIVAIIAAFGFPDYSKSRQVTDERDGAANLTTIYAGMNVYRVHNNGFPTFNLNTVNDINTTLDIGIIEQNMTYNCTSSANNYTCYAISPYGWNLEIRPGGGGRAKCSSGTCPTCTGAGCGFQ